MPSPRLLVEDAPMAMAKAQESAVSLPRRLAGTVQIKWANDHISSST